MEKFDIFLQLLEKTSKQPEEALNRFCWFCNISRYLYISNNILLASEEALQDEEDGEELFIASVGAVHQVSCDWWRRVT